MAGNDKLFHMRKARKMESHKRMIARRDPYDMVLIVCEGEKTEVNYFNALIDELKLNTANVEVADNTAGSSPRSVVDCALKTYRKCKEQGKEYNRIYCVIDRDRHQNYHEALDVIKRTRLGKRNFIKSVVSTPCFEFWILLHYICTTKYYYTGVGSVCAKVIADLKRYMPEYEKGNIRIFLKLKDMLKKACKHAKNIDDNNDKINEFSSNTIIYKLVSDLECLKANNKSCMLD